MYILNIFKHVLPQNNLANQKQILRGASMGHGSDKTTIRGQMSVFRAIGPLFYRANRPVI